MIFEDIDRRIYEEYIHEQESRSLREIGVYWPSNASAMLDTGRAAGACLRASFYGIKGVPMSNPPSVAQIRKMAYGKAIEDYELEKAQAAGTLVDRQVSFVKKIAPKNPGEHEISIHGKADGVGVKDSILVGMEYKSGNGYSFTKQIWGTHTELGFPRYSNLFQAMLYIDGFSNHEKYKFDTCYLMYIDRGTGADKDMKIQLKDGYPVVDGQLYTMTNISSIYDRYQQLNGYLSKNYLPEKDYRNFIPMDEVTEMYGQKLISKTMYNNFFYAGYGMDMECSYCNFRDHCREDDQMR